MPKLDGKVAIVTGGARGIGGASATALAEDGATVLIADVLDEVGEAHAKALRARQLKAEYHPHDVRDAAKWAALVAHALNVHGRLDILVNNAGIGHGTTIEDASLADLQNTLDINLIGPFHGMKAAIPAMRQSGGGSIINIASNATRMATPVNSIYGTSKSGLADMTKTTAVHCARSGYNIRVNSIHPGIHETPMVVRDSEKAAGDIPEIKALIDAIPMGRLGRPEELGRVVVFLASEDSSYMTGSEVFSDGGLAII